MRLRLGRLGSITSLRFILAFGFALLLLLSNLISFTGSFSSPVFANAFGQSADGKKASLQATIDDRAAQSLDNAKKLRQAAGERIPNHYIVVLKDKTAPPAEVRSAAEEARSQGAVLRHLYEHAIRGYAIRIPNDKVLDSILKNPEVAYVQPDVKVKAFSQSLPTGIDRVDGDLSSAKSGDGTGTFNVDIAILDTGIDLSNPDLNVYKQTTFVAGTSSGADDAGHGTMVAGVAAAKDDSQGVVGMAPGARLWAIKVLDSNGQGFDSDIIEGIDYITQHADEIDVVNMSFGGDGPDSALHTAIINSVNAGVTYTAAAGNEAVDAGSVVPASFPEVITVSAIADSDGKCGSKGPTTKYGSDDTLASFSNYGSVIDLAAPGVSVQTTARGGSTASFSGTSAATPHVTGAAALYKVGHPGATPSDILNGLRNAGSTPATSCDGKGHGYFTGDRDSVHEPVLYVGSSTSSSDTTLPTVGSTNPSSGATDVAVTSSVVATFSEAVQITTVSASTFTLKKSDGTSISGSVSLGTDAKTATFKPSSLAASTSYTATVTTGVKDMAGNAMTPAKSWSFTTAATAANTSPPSSTCNNNLPVGAATSSGSQSTFLPTNAIDNNFNTKWYSTFIVKPWIRLDLGATKSICSINIAWTDGATRQYSFFISVSSDGTNFNTVFTGKSSGTTSPQKYSFAESSTRYVRITVTQSHAGSANSIAQISEIDVFGKTSTSALSTASESHSNSKLNRGSLLENASPGNIINHRPNAKDDTVKTKVNTQILAPILNNDFDPDGDRLNLVSVSHHTKNGGTVTLTNNGTVSVLPAPNFVGLDTFSYTISDGKGKTDKAKVSVIVTQLDKTDKPDVASQQEEGAKKQEEGKVQLNNGPDSKIILGDNLTKQLIR